MSLSSSEPRLAYIIAGQSCWTAAPATMQDTAWVRSYLINKKQIFIFESIKPGTSTLLMSCFPDEGLHLQCNNIHAIVAAQQEGTRCSHALRELIAAGDCGLRHSSGGIIGPVLKPAIQNVAKQHTCL